MKTLIVILIIASFIQSTILPISLVLIVLICRSYLKSDNANLFLAFAFGLTQDHLNLTVLGLTSLSYLIIVTIIGGLSKSRLAGNTFLIIPLTFVLLLINQVALIPFTHQNIQILNILLESFLSFPILYIVRFWEERFIVKRDIKLRV